MIITPFGPRGRAARVVDRQQVGSPISGRLEDAGARRAAIAAS